MPRKTDTAEAVKETETQAAAEEVKQENLMYVGPTIPEMRSLFIPVIKYPLAEKMLRERKGYIFSAFRKALEYKTEGGK